MYGIQLRLVYKKSLNLAMLLDPVRVAHLILLIGKSEETTTLVLPEEPLHTWSYLRGSERTCRSKRQYETLSACPSPDGSRTRRWQSGVITSFAICSKGRIEWKGPASFRWTHNPFTEPWVYRWNANEHCYFVVPPTSQPHYLQPLDKNVFLPLKKHWNRLYQSRWATIGYDVFCSHIFDYAWFSRKKLIAIKKFKMMEKLYLSKNNFENGDGSWPRYLPPNRSLLGIWHATDIISTESTPIFWYCVWKRQKIDTSHTLQVTTYNVIYTR